MVLYDSSKGKFEWCRVLLILGLGDWIFNRIPALGRFWPSGRVPQVPDRMLFQALENEEDEEEIEMDEGVVRIDQRDLEDSW